MKFLSASQIRSQAALEALQIEPKRPDIPPLSKKYEGGKSFTVTHVQS